MIRIAYTSVASEGLGPEGVFNIVQKSSHNNATAGLTGFLIFIDRRFFQVVEGPKDAIEDLMTRIEDDDRHHSIEIISRDEIEGATFPKWKMRRFAPAKPVRDLEDLSPEFAQAPLPVKQAANHFLEQLHTA